MTVENWILIVVFTSFFNGQSTVTRIDGYTSQEACQKAAAKYRWPDGSAKCVPGPK